MEAARESAAAAYTAAANDDAETAPEIPFNGHTVAIDAGHQGRGEHFKGAHRSVLHDDEGEDAGRRGGDNQWSP